MITNLNKKLLCLVCIFASLAIASPGCLPSEKKEKLPLTIGEPFKLYDPGAEDIIDYNKYGTFFNIGTKDYRYKMKDIEGLAEAAGEGIYPNLRDVYQDPQYQQLKKEGLLEGSHWDFINSANPQADFYKWATAQEDQGVKLFFTAEALRRSGHILHAIKAYYTIVVLYPKSICWGADAKFYWYVGLEAIARIRKLCSSHPELRIQLQGAWIDIDRKQDNNPYNDIVKVDIGRFIKIKQERIDPSQLEIIEQRGKGKVCLVKFSNGHWQLRVDGKPFIVKGISYSLMKIGESPHICPLTPWQTMDKNNNKLNDGMFDSWIDKNRNGMKDGDEPAVGDAQLLMDMGCNAIRYYHYTALDGYVPEEYNKELLRKLYKDYGIYMILGDFLGAYTIGSGADWSEGTDYTNDEQKQRMKQIVKKMVLDHKDEPYVLMWLLGNENANSDNPEEVNFTNTNANRYFKEYMQFVNEVAETIHELDPNHPVAIGNHGIIGIKELDKYAPAVDILGINQYAGEYSLGSVWILAKHYYDRPVLITEYGCDAYHEGIGINEEEQARYHEGNWKDIELNLAGNTGEGNAVGGVIYEWMDEWWKSGKAGYDGAPYRHDTKGTFPFIFPDGWSHEEWLGIVGQGSGNNSPFERNLRESYFLYKKLWNK